MCIAADLTFVGKRHIEVHGINTRLWVVTQWSMDS